MITRPYPRPPQSSTLPYMVPQDQIEQEPIGYLPGGIKPPGMPDEGPGAGVPPPDMPEEPDEDDGLGQKFLRALGQTIGRARRSSQDHQPFFVRQRTE